MRSRLIFVRGTEHGKAGQAQQTDHEMDKKVHAIVCVYIQILFDACVLKVLVT